jgi:hypothetical protein
MRDLIAAKLFTREAVPGAYVITLAPKGQQFVDLHGAKAAEKVTGTVKPVKAAGKPKGKAKAKPATIPAQAETPISEAPTVTEGQQAELTA